MSTFHARRRAALGGLDTHGLPLVIRHLPTIRYLTGFSGSNATLVLGGESSLLITDGRYRDEVQTIVADDVDVEAVIDRDWISVVAKQASRSALAIDPSVEVHHARGLESCGVHVKVASTALHGIRQVKDDRELSCLAAACRITAIALATIAQGIRIGDTEIQIARRLESEFGRLGAQDRAFPTIVATGGHSAMPHHSPTDTAVRSGDLIVVDCGAMVDGYHADMTRTFIAGEATPEQTRLHAVVHEANVVARGVASPGVRAAEVDAAARKVVEASGLGEYFTHGTGHGVGLEIHEAPMINASSTDTISAGTPITIEPGIYVPGVGGVRIEDTIVVGNPGQILTDAPRDLIVVG